MERSLYCIKTHLFSFLVLSSCVTRSFSCQCKAVKSITYGLPQAVFFLNMARFLSDSEQVNEIHLYFLLVFFQNWDPNSFSQREKKGLCSHKYDSLAAGLLHLRIRLLSKFTAGEERKKKHWILKETHRLVITVVGYLYARNFSYNLIKSIVIEVILGPDQKLMGSNRGTMSYCRSIIKYCLAT